MPTRPFGVDEIRQGAVKDVRIKGPAGLDHIRHRKLACRHLPQLQCLPTLAANPEPPAHHEAEWAVRAGHEVRERASVGVEAEVGVGTVLVAVDSVDTRTAS
jgi:hypothetical protein